MKAIVTGGQAADGEVEQAALGPQIRLEILRTLRAEEVADPVFAGVDAVLAWHMPLPAPVIPRLTRCRIVVVYGVGHDHVDAEAFGRAGIPVCNVPDYGTDDVADHAMAMLVALRRGLPTFADLIATDPVGGWRFAAGPLMRRLRGDRLGIVGFGRIGRAVARRAAGFGLEVVWHDPHVERADDAPGARLAELDELLATSHAVTLHCPLTAETRSLIDAAAIARMRPDAILVNTARGAVVDVDAVAAALRAGRLGGAALDVFPEEPPDPDSPLVAAFRLQPTWAAGRVLLSPHAAFYSPQSWRELREKCATTAREFLLRGRLTNCVNRQFLPDSGLRQAAKHD